MFFFAKCLNVCHRCSLLSVHNTCMSVWQFLLLMFKLHWFSLLSTTLFPAQVRNKSTRSCTKKSKAYNKSTYGPVTHDGVDLAWQAFVVQEQIESMESEHILTLAHRRFSIHYSGNWTVCNIIHQHIFLCSCVSCFVHRNIHYAAVSMLVFHANVVCVGLRRIVAGAFFAPCINILTYLLTYLLKRHADLMSAIRPKIWMYGKTQ